jgi:conjugative transfer ATPase
MIKTLLARAIGALNAAIPAPARAAAGVQADAALLPAHWFTGRSLTRKDVNDANAAPPSFADYLRFRTWDAVTGCFVLSDYRSAGVLYELTPAATEGRDDATIAQLHDAFLKAAQTGLAEDVESPWITQWFVQDEPSLFPFFSECEQYITPAIRTTEFSTWWLKEVDEHLQQVSQPGGIFAVGRQPWRGRSRRVFVTLYRNAPSRKDTLHAALRATNEAATQFEAAFESNGVSLKRCRGRDLVRWMQPFLNPAPEATGGDPYARLRTEPFPDESGDRLPPHFDLANWALRSSPQHVQNGVWSCEDRLYTTLTVQIWTSTLGFGHLTGEDDQARTLMDELPEGTRIAVTLVAEPQYKIDRHLTLIEESAVGTGAHAAQSLLEVAQARKAMATGEKLYRVNVALTVTAESLDALNGRVQRCSALMTKKGLPVYAQKHDLYRAKAFTDNLPFGWSQTADQSGPKRATLQYTSEIAKILPIAGRSTGTNSPCLKYFNRGASPLSIDPIRNRLRNAHMTVFGPTGSGKSATLTAALLDTMSVHRPYLWIVDPKWPAPSFGLLIDQFRDKGLTVNHVRLSANADIALNPFHNALLLLDDEFAPRVVETEDDIEGGRDLLGEMMYLTVAMITGGEEAEIARMTRADRTVVAEAIVLAAKTVRDRQLAAGDIDASKSVVLTQDVVDALETISNKAPNGARYFEMSKALKAFTQGTAGRIFNRPGTPWPTHDVTLIEFATLGSEGYGAELSVAFMSLLQAIQTHITRYQRGGRDTLVVVDEVHTVAKNQLMGSYIAKIIKTWRSAGAWYWQATQSIADFAGPMKPLLTQLEWMLCLSMPKDEVKQLRELKNLTNEQATMVESATKLPGQYVEGVVLHETCTALFRAVLPAQALALAQTGKHERHARTVIQTERGCTELEAVTEVARRIKQSRAKFAEQVL